MGYGTSLGTAHEDEISYVMENNMTFKQFNDRKEINTNSTSGDFQSRFSASDTSTMPLEASRKLTHALKSKGSTEVPEKPPETNFVDKLLGTNDTERYQTWPERLARSAFTLPGDVLSGKVQPGSIQEIERAADLASVMVMGPAPVAAKMADGSLGSFAGVKSKTLPKDKLYEAQNMELDSMHPDDIWDKTGFFRGADTRWRYEIPDKDAKLKDSGFDKVLETLPHGEVVDSIVPKTPQRVPAKNIGDLFFPAHTEQSLSLDKVIDHPELFKAYPELKTMKVEPLPEFLKGKVSGMHLGDTIYLAEGHPEYVRSIILHEIQHGIQHHEGFAYGGNQEQFLPKELPQAEKEFLQIKQEIEPEILKDLEIKPLVIALGDKVEMAKKYIRQEQEGNTSVKRIVDALKRDKPLSYKRLSNIIESEKLIKQAKEEAFSKYQRLMGEVESRNVQVRRNYDEAARRISPQRTEDITRLLQINP